MNDKRFGIAVNYSLVEREMYCMMFEIDEENMTTIPDEDSLTVFHDPKWHLLTDEEFLLEFEVFKAHSTKKH
jgi:hypothetical protein